MNGYDNKGTYVSFIPMLSLCYYSTILSRTLQSAYAQKISLQYIRNSHGYRMFFPMKILVDCMVAIASYILGLFT